MMDDESDTCLAKLNKLFSFYESLLMLKFFWFRLISNQVTVSICYLPKVIGSFLVGAAGS